MLLDLDHQIFMKAVEKSQGLFRVCFFSLFDKKPVQNRLDLSDSSLNTQNNMLDLAVFGSGACVC